MPDTNADKFQSEGTLVAVNPDTVNFADGLEATLTGSTLAVGIKAPKAVVEKQVCAVADFTDNEDATGTLVTDINIPVGAIFKQAYVVDVTGFAGDTSAALTIGDGTDVDRYNTSTIDVFSTAGEVAAGVPSGVDYHAAAKDVTLTITSNSDFSAVVTDGNGELTLVVEYIETA